MDLFDFILHSMKSRAGFILSFHDGLWIDQYPGQRWGNMTKKAEINAAV